MTLKQDTLINKLPENGFNISKTARQVGYTESSSKSGLLYEAIRKRVAKEFNQDNIKAKILKAEKKFIKDNDNANYARMIELQSKAVGLTKDNHVLQTTIFQGLSDKDLPPIDITEVKPSNEPKPIC
jgi:hypothetical protein